MGSGQKLRILTFNRHEPYMYELAKTGHDFDLLLVDRGPWPGGWDVQSRPIPPNVATVGKAEDMTSLDLDQYDLLLAQTYDDFELLQRFCRPTIALFHTPAALLGPSGLSRAEALRRVYQEWQLAPIPVIYVSHYVAQNWGVPGRIILHSLDIRDYESFRNTGRIAAVLTVAHFFKEREEHGYSLHRQVVGERIPYKIVGHNPSLPDAKPAREWDELKGFYRDYRMYLNTTTWGGSLAMLEAMAAGMPVVTTPGLASGRPHKSVIDGFNGYVAADPDELRNKVEFLLTNPEVAKAMGQKARETVVRKYGTERFVQEWQEVFEDAVTGWRGGRARPVGNLPDAYYEKASLIPEHKASLGKALFWPVDGPGEHVLYGPFIHLPAGAHEIEFFLRPRLKLDFTTPAIPMIRVSLMRLHRRLVRGNPEVAVVDVCSGPDGEVHASRALHVSDFRRWGSYQAFRLSFHSSAEKLFQFRVFATGAIPVQVDPHATWASLRRVVS